jgi:protein tyrosine/serine phosphatase
MSAAPTDTRWIDLEGAVNVRDLGGLPLAYGGTTSAGVLLRSDNLQHLTPRDVEELVERRDLSVVVDLRTGVEVEREGPGPLIADARVDVRHRSLYPEAGEATDVDVDDTTEIPAGLLPWQVHGLGGHDTDESPAVRAYLRYLRDRPDSVVGALHDIEGAPGATLVHCAAGKDRTGMVCAFALAVAGVERHAIVEDYALTGERIEQILARLKASPTYAADLDGKPAHVHAPRPETMARILELLDERHGGVTGWLTEHGFGEQAQQRLAARLTG